MYFSIPFKKIPHKSGFIINIFYDYIFIDRSAKLDPEAVNKINTYLDLSHNTKLVLYLRTEDDQILNQLLPKADLIFHEDGGEESEKSYAPELKKIDAAKLINISEHQLLNHQLF